MRFSAFAYRELLSHHPGVAQERIGASMDGGFWRKGFEVKVSKQARAETGSPEPDGPEDAHTSDLSSSYI